ncbi:MAG: dNTP triphosphohydrolase [Candidatus Atribacteria bacterium]|nr:dNTP triphosphohydrolase [Candidatus Atribacteria bacterium]
MPCPRANSEAQEPRYLSSFATKSTDELAIRREHDIVPDEFRTQFERDYTRIIHNRAFRRLRHKTQVFISPANDHLCTRIEHSLHVASVARTISKALGLNNELVAAIAVGHDLGHAPFGHTGERVLDRLARKHGLAFAHELHSLRMVDRLDSTYDDYRGLNLTFAVRDGIACHYGEGFEPELVPDRHKKPERLLVMERGEKPATLEGCVVRIADKVAYLGRDLEDALSVKMVCENSIPHTVRRVLGTCNGAIIGALIGDIYKNSQDKDSICLSADVHGALNEFYQFSRERIYQSPQVTRSFEVIEASIDRMFDHLLRLMSEWMSRDDGDPDVPEDGGKCLKVLVEFLRDDVRLWRKENPVQLVIDFIAGMTDTFFMDCHKELFVPAGERCPIRALLGQ